MRLFRGYSCFLKSLIFVLPVLFLFTSAPQADVIVTQPLVALSWSPSPDADTKGYEVYRATAADGAYAKISPALVQATAWSDANVADGARYYYKLQATDTCGNAGQLSTASEAAVIQLSGSSGDTYLNQLLVRLSWNPSPETDTRGYDVYRATIIGGAYAKVSTSLVQATTWTDSGVTNGNSYYYKLNAVDTCGNVSQFSPASGAAIIDMTSPTVTASPPPGAYSQTVSVTLQSSETSTIYYTTDGSTPTQSSAVYSSPILLMASTTLKYVAIDRATNQSPVTTAQYNINPFSDDSDGDGYPDSLEEAMGTNPNDAASRPVAATLTIAQPDGPIAVGSTMQLTVIGTFIPAVGEPLEQDLSSMVQYYFDSSVVSVSASGLVTGVAEWISDIWAEQEVNAAASATSNTIQVTVDGTPPAVNLSDSRPYDTQGTDQDNGPAPRVPIDSGIVIRVADPDIGQNIGIDEGSIKFVVNQSEVPATVHEIVEGDLHELDIAYQNTSPFGFDQVVTVEMSLADMAGNQLTFSESFQVESQADHQWALDNSPPQSATVMGDGTIEASVLPEPDALNDELLEGAKIIFAETESVQPRFAPVGEIPALDLAAPAGIPLTIEPLTVFDKPVTVLVPVPGAQVEDTNQDGMPDIGLEAYDLYCFSPRPDVLWRNASLVSGWIVEGSRIDHYDTVPACIEVQITQPVVLQAGLAGAGELSPDIKINGQDGIVFVARGSSVSITLSLASGNITEPVDWWILAATPKGWYSYDMTARRWIKGLKVSLQAPPSAMADEQIYAGRPPFGSGNYTVFFAVDNDLDGIVDATWIDSIHVYVYR